jgi:hypothetical protein
LRHSWRANPKAELRSSENKCGGLLIEENGASAQQAIYIEHLKDKLLSCHRSRFSGFATMVERVERLRAVQREALRQAEHLFASLLNRVFCG